MVLHPSNKKEEGHLTYIKQWWKEGNVIMWYPIERESLFMSSEWDGIAEFD